MSSALQWKLRYERLHDTAAVVYRRWHPMHPMPSEWEALRMALFEPDCPECGDERTVDSGGTTPWGEGIKLPCPMCVEGKRR